MSRMNLMMMIITVMMMKSTQGQAPSPSPTPSPSDLCNGIYISYRHTKTTKLAPDLSKSDPTRQPYRFESTLTVLNNGLDQLKSWRVSVNFTHDELLVSATNVVLTDGTSFPARVGNGTVFSGFPVGDLKTAFETAGDLTQMEVRAELVGTQFGVAPPGVPLPTNVELLNDGFLCGKVTKQGERELQVCCTKDPNFKSNNTVDDEFLPRQNGDLTIMYDVTSTYDDKYWAQVTISNHNPLGRLDNWRLSWDWMRDEFIFKMRGAYPSVVDTSDCIYGKQGQYYRGFDFSEALNCERRPTIVDLPLTKANDSALGLVPFCCRNGTILPPTMDSSKSTSVFQINVFKMPPDLNRSQLSPPQNWRINGTLNPDYKCGPPVRVSPTIFPNTNGLSSGTTAVASWQVVCNITQAKGTSPRCCVSFSSYYNDSVIPCKTCACGCPGNTEQICSTTSPAILLPSEALLVPFENRTKLAKAYLSHQRKTVPDPLPCGDNCGVSINWHVNTDYKRGWTSRLTVFNWDETNFVDWFVAVQMDKAAAGFEAVYSFNGSVLDDGVRNNNNTIFMQGLPGLNYLVAETDGPNPQKDPRVPGKQQSVISFTKKQTPGIRVASGDGFPTKVFFNGEECSLPSIIPTGIGYRKGSNLMFTVIVVMILMIIQL